MNESVALWHKVVASRDTALLAELLADDVIFQSPIVHTPQKGKKITLLYLTAAMHVLLSEKFEYVLQTDNAEHTILEFEALVDGVAINGVDMITWNEEGKISQFKVMIRPLKAMNLIHQKMGALLAKYQVG